MRQSWMALGALGSALLWAGCGGEGSDGAPSTPDGTGGTMVGVGGAATGGSATGGSPATGGGTATGGGSTDQPTTLNSKRAACRAYVTAQCQRVAECAKDPDMDCTAGAVGACPDLMFSEGSLRTIEGLFACAEEWKTLDCSLVGVGSAPDCAIGGTLADGEPCIVAAQCASNVCSTSFSTCGKCLPVVASGAACQEGVNACPPGESCDSDSFGVCEPTTPYVFAARGTKAQGESCYGDAWCQDGLTCASDDAGQSTICRPKLAEGASCYSSSPSGEGHVCTDLLNRGLACGADLKCHALPTQGQPCMVTSENTYVCHPDLYCAAGTVTCEEVPRYGEPCGDFAHEPGAGVHGKTCRAASCVDGTCVATREEGEACSEASVECADGTECVGGVCRATDELTLYAETCAL